MNIKEEIAEYLRENLTIEVKTSSNYTGGMDGGSLYRDSHTLQLILEGEVISEVSL